MPLPPRNHRKERFSPERQMQPPPPAPSPNHDHDIVPFSSSSSMADNFFSPLPLKPFLLPPGFRFEPTDEELILHYLKPFLQNKQNSSPYFQIHRVNIYESDPEQLSREYEKGNDKEWFFITERTKVTEGGKSQKRGDNNGGYWQKKAAAKKIDAGEGVVGYRAALAYLVGKAPKGVKTDWLMLEYWIESSATHKVDYALCKIYLTPRANKRKAEEEEEGEEERKRSKCCNNNNGCEKTLSVEIQQPYQSQDQQKQLHFLPLISDEELYEMLNPHEILDEDEIDDFLAGYIDLYPSR